MRSTFPTREQLSAMPLARLRLVDVADMDEEKLLQEVINIKAAAEPPERPVYIADIPDIKTPEEEKAYQKIVDERTKKVKGLNSDVPPEPEQNPEELSDTEKVEAPKVFCEMCGSKGTRHKKGCPTLSA